MHSWNGKFRRPAGLATDGFDKPMRGDLLWVYEGLTQYLGWVLSMRAGLVSPEWWRDDLGATAALMDTRAGRSWRPLEDTAVGAQLLHRSSPEWQSWRRAADYYPEGLLIWLDADVLIRTRSNGARSLDDFARVFYGGPNHGAEVKPYTFDELVVALDGVMPNDWRAFFHARVDQVEPRAPLGGITGGGWRLTYDSKPNEKLRAIAKEDKLESFSYSLGFSMKEDGQVQDVIPATPAAKAGLAPAMRVLGVDGRKLTKESFGDALKLDRGAIELLVLNSDFYKILRIAYRGGAKDPHLVREAAKPDLLSAIGRPLQTVDGADQVGRDVAGERDVILGERAPQLAAARRDLLAVERGAPERACPNRARAGSGPSRSPDPRRCRRPARRSATRSRTRARRPAR